MIAGESYDGDLLEIDDVCDGLMVYGYGYLADECGGESHPYSVVNIVNNYIGKF